jgi:hypothetical protein
MARQEGLIMRRRHSASRGKIDGCESEVCKRVRLIYWMLAFRARGIKCRMKRMHREREIYAGASDWGKADTDR